MTGLLISKWEMLFLVARLLTGPSSASHLLLTLSPVLTLWFWISVILMLGHCVSCHSPASQQMLMHFPSIACHLILPDPLTHLFLFTYNSALTIYTFQSHQFLAKFASMCVSLLWWTAALCLGLVLSLTYFSSKLITNSTKLPSLHYMHHMHHGSSSLLPYILTVMEYEVCLYSHSHMLCSIYSFSTYLFPPSHIHCLWAIQICPPPACQWWSGYCSCWCCLWPAWWPNAPLCCTP